MAGPQKYNRPPITEAILEFQFEEPCDDRDLDRLRDQFKRAYPSLEWQHQIRVNVEAGKATTNTALNGYKMTAKNAIDVLLVQRASLGTIRLGPYNSWEALQSSAKENYETFAKIVGRRKITRLGARYLNRFDVPSSDIEGKSLTNFLNVGLALPQTVATAIGLYTLMVECREASTGSKVRIHSGTITPALLDHLSITLDIDAYLDTDIPTRMDEVWKCTDVLRQAKNSVFENSITDTLRAYIR